MAVELEIVALSDLEQDHPTLEAALRLFQDQLNALPPDEVEAVINAASRALAHSGHEQRSPVVAALTEGMHITPAQRVETALAVHLRSYERRRELLEGALTASQVAELLGTTRQTPHDRVKSGRLLAVMDRGAWRFPLWQFDPEGADGVIEGLPDVIRALDVTPLAKVSWMTRANPMLDDETPLACLRAGQIERVATLARSVAVD